MSNHLCSDVKISQEHLKGETMAKWKGWCDFFKRTHFSPLYWLAVNSETYQLGDTNSETYQCKARALRDKKSPPSAALLTVSIHHTLLTQIVSIRYIRKRWFNYAFGETPLMTKRDFYYFKGQNCWIWV